MERRHHLAWLAGLSATAGVGYGFPLAGIPLALGLAAYAAIRSCRPDHVLRGRWLSPFQHHRAAVVGGGLILLGSALFSLTIYSLTLAGRLEHRLQQDAALGFQRGELKVGQAFEACEGLACAQARIIQLATARTLGIARLSGFAMHDQTIYAWPSPTRAALSRILQPLR
ncbi:MAG TPA: hypothetical protein VJ770_01855 [Stellaceae bacterium]|nr:hypothetical protein [Stellaceae bacterium]